MTKAKREYECDICPDKIEVGEDYYRYDSPPWEGEKAYEANPKFDHYHMHKECIGILTDFLEEIPDEGYNQWDIDEARRNAEIELFNNEFGELHSWKELREAYTKRKAIEVKAGGLSENE